MTGSPACSFDIAVGAAHAAVLVRAGLEVPEVRLKPGVETEAMTEGGPAPPDPADDDDPPELEPLTKAIEASHRVVARHVANAAASLRSEPDGRMCRVPVAAHHSGFNQSGASRIGRQFDDRASMTIESDRRRR